MILSGSFFQIISHPCILALGKEVIVSKGYRTLSPYPFVTTFLFQKICQIPNPCTVHACQLIHIFYVPSISTILPILPLKDIPHFQLNPCYSRHRDFKQTLKNSTLVWKYQPPSKSNPSSKNLSNTAIIRFLASNVISMAFQLSQHRFLLPCKRLTQDTHFPSTPYAEQLL